MIWIKLKPLLPILREKKRYITFNAESKSNLDYVSLKGAINESLKGYIGDLGSSKAGLIFMDKLYDSDTQTGVVRVGNKYVDHLKASFALIKNINKHPVIVKSIKTSGALSKINNKQTKNNNKKQKNTKKS